MSQLDQVTQANAAMVEENTAAAHTLRQDSDRLAEFVGRFRTQNQSGEGEAPPALPAPASAAPVSATDAGGWDDGEIIDAHAEPGSAAEDHDTAPEPMRANDKWTDF